MRSDPPRCFVLPDIQEELQDGRPVAGEMFSKSRIDSSLVPQLPAASTSGSRWESRISVNLYDQHFLVVAPVEDAYPAALGQMLVNPPQKVVIQFVLAAS